MTQSYTNFFASVPENKMLALGYGRYGRNSSFFYFKGGLDDVRIYNRPLYIFSYQVSIGQVFGKFFINLLY
jgi:hypothetical protein